MKVAEVIILIIIMDIGIAVLGIFPTLLIAFIIAIILSLAEKYTPQQPKAKGTQRNWRCRNCGRINAPHAKICTKCGFEKKREQV